MSKSSNQSSNKRVTQADTLLRRRKERNQNRGNTEPADWATVEPNILLRYIATITRLGAVVSFGYTRDGGAYMYSVYLNGDTLREYIRPTENVDQRFIDEIEYWSTE